jgi:hypothetical protein
MKPGGSNIASERILDANFNNVPKLLKNSGPIILTFTSQENLTRCDRLIRFVRNRSEPNGHLSEIRNCSSSSSGNKILFGKPP